MIGGWGGLEPLGFDDGGLLRYLRTEGGFSVPEIMATGLIMEDRGNGMPLDFLTSCVTIPYHVANNVITIRGRSMVPDAKAKYKTLAGAKARLFNSDATWHATELFIAEAVAQKTSSSWSTKPAATAKTEMQ